MTTTFTVNQNDNENCLRRHVLLLAMVNDLDAGHGRAMEFSASYHGVTLTTEWILTEIADALSAPLQRPAFLELLDSLIHDSTVTIIEVKHEQFFRGVDLFAHRFDKAWSLTDCISFNVMQEFGVSQALTADHHFAQAGFVPLLV